jgi:urocanate hydratase
MLSWDVLNGIARRAWARNDGAVWTANKAMEHEPRLRITVPEIADRRVVEKALEDEQRGQ